MSDVEPESLFDLPPDEAVEAAANAAAEAEIEAGLGVPHDVVREWLIKRAKGERVPPPFA